MSRGMQIVVRYTATVCQNRRQRKENGRLYYTGSGTERDKDERIRGNVVLHSIVQEAIGIKYIGVVTPIGLMPLRKQGRECDSAIINISQGNIKTLAYRVWAGTYNFSPWSP